MQQNNTRHHMEGRETMGTSHRELPEIRLLRKLSAASVNVSALAEHVRHISAHAEFKGLSFPLEFFMLLLCLHHMLTDHKKCFVFFIIITSSHTLNLNLLFSTRQ